MANRANSITRLVLMVLVSVAVTTSLSKTVPACDTPVYRYAMYRWTPTPYEVYYFHEDFFQEEKYNEKDTASHKAIERLSADPERPANIVLVPVNLFADKELRGVPPDVRKMWQKQENKSLPRYLLVSPQGAHVYSGALTSDEIASLATSAARQRIADLLADGRSGTFVLLTGKDKSANESAEKMLNALAADVAAGKVDLYSSPQPGSGSPAVGSEEGPDSSSPQNEGDIDKEDTEKSAPSRQIGVVTLDRDDPKERWLSEMLLAVEPDLKDKDFEDQPMVFVVYGRARALPPYIGKGITRNNMLEVLDFITGACSCTVKEQNPGVDLLTRYDWETAAEKLADRFGTEEGNEGFYAPDEFFPELIVGAGNTKIETPVENPEQTETVVVSADSTDTPKLEPADSSGTGTGSASNDDQTGNGKDEPDDADKQVPSNDSAKPDRTSAKDGATSPTEDNSEVAALKTDQPTSTASTSPSEGDAATNNSWMYTLGLGIGVGLFLLIGASFLLFRNR